MGMGMDMGRMFVAEILLAPSLDDVLNYCSIHLMVRFDICLYWMLDL